MTPPLQKEFRHQRNTTKLKSAKAFFNSTIPASVIAGMPKRKENVPHPDASTSNRTPSGCSPIAKHPNQGER